MDSTVELIQGRGLDSHSTSVEFYENGEFMMTDMPGWFLGWSYQGPYAGKGTWNVGRDMQGYWVIQVTFSSLSPGYYPALPSRDPQPCPGETVPCGGLKEQFDMWERQPPYYICLDLFNGEYEPDLCFTRPGDIHKLE